MFGLFNSKTEKEKLEAKYRKLMEASHQLSHIDRTKSDQKMAEAATVLEAIDALENKKA